MATPKSPYEVIFTPEKYDEKLFKLDHTFDLDKFHPPSSDDLKRGKREEHVKAGYTRLRPDARIEAIIKTDPPDGNPSQGKHDIEWWYEPFRVTFFLRDIEVYISSNYPENSCPYRATYVHETEAHVVASIRVFLAQKDKIVTALNGMASILPRKDKRNQVSPENLKSHSDRLEARIGDIIKEELRNLSKELKEESARQDTHYDSVYKQCSMDEWNMKI